MDQKLNQKRINFICYIFLYIVLGSIVGIVPGLLVSWAADKIEFLPMSMLLGACILPLLTMLIKD